MPTYLIPRDVARLAREVRASELSVSSIAAAAGITRQYLGRLTRGERVRLNSASAAAIEKTLGLESGELFQLDTGDDLSPYLPEDAA